jgi:hypothetical protein
MSELNFDPLGLRQFVDGIESYRYRAATAAFPQAGNLFRPFGHRPVGDDLSAFEQLIAL